MHFIVMMRGIKHLQDKLIDEIGKIMLPMWMRVEDMTALASGANTSGAKTTQQMNMVQVAVRPIQLYEIVFPKEHEDLMAATLFKDHVGGSNQKWLRKWFNLVRKLLHLEPINWDFRKEPHIPLPKDWVEIIGIGKKYDKERNDDKNKYEAL